MRHYEVILMIHPDKKEKIIAMINYYKKIISTSKGRVHRLEDWGRRSLSYPIKKLHKAYYILMNVEVFPNIIDDLKNSFRFDDSVIRSMIIRVKCAITEPSPIMKMVGEEIEGVSSHNIVR